MRSLFLCSLLAFGALSAAPAQARDTAYNLKISDALQLPEFREKLGSDVTFFFGPQHSPPVAQTIGEFISNRKTNAFGKPDETACRWALLSALISFKERALKDGGDAVINIVSFYKKEP
nr:excinuclease ABC subunit A [uncultured Rhodopila sp.]